MGRVRVTRAARAQAGFSAGVLIAAAGVFLAFGLGWALIVAGSAVTAGFALLYDVSEPELPHSTRRERRPFLLGEDDE